jgi:hypothetical protein
MGDEMNAYWLLVGKPEGNISRLQQNIKADFLEAYELMINPTITTFRLLLLIVDAISCAGINNG